MAVFNKKGGAQGGSGPLRWLPVGTSFNLLRLMFQSAGSPSGPFKNPAYKSYIAKISNEPLDFLMPDRSILAARCAWIISGGRPSQHGFHLVIIANGRENLQKLTGQEGVSSRHFSAELIAEAARADAAERSNMPAPKAVTIKAKPKPVSKPVDDFSDLSGALPDTSSKASFLDDLDSAKPAAARKMPPAVTELDDEFAAPVKSGGKVATTDLSDLEGGSDDLDFQKYEDREKPAAAKARAKGPAPDEDFLSAPTEDELKAQSIPSLVRSNVKVPQDTGFLSDMGEDPAMVATGGRTWSLDEEAPPAARPEPAGDEMLESAEPELEAPAEPEIPADEAVLPEEPEAPAAAEAVVAEENPFGSEEAPAVAAVSAPPIEAEAIPEENPFEELDAKPAEAAPAPAESPASESFGGENPFEDIETPLAAAAPAESHEADEFAGAAEVEPQTATPEPVAAEEAPGWDFSDDHSATAAAPAVAQPEPVAVEPPKMEEDEFATTGAAHAEPGIFDEQPSAPESGPPASEEEPVAMGDFAAEAEQMAARVAGESDGGAMLEEPVQPVEPPSPVIEPAIQAAASFDDEPMFADETEAALGEAEALTDPEALISRAAPKPAAVLQPSGDDNSFAHDDVAYLEGLPKDAASGELRSANIRNLETPPATEPVPVPPPSNRFDELRAQGAPVAFDDEAVAVGDEVSDAEDIFGDRQRVSKLHASEFPEEAGNGQDMDSATMADLRYTNFNTEEATAKALAEADSIMTAEDFFKEETGAGSESEPAAETPVAEAVPEKAPPSVEPVPEQAPVPAAAEPLPPVKPAGSWRIFTTDVSTELKARAKQAKVVERAPDMLRFDLKVRVLWANSELSEGTLCVKDRAPSVYLSPSDIRKIPHDAEVEF